MLGSPGRILAAATATMVGVAAMGSLAVAPAQAAGQVFTVSSASCTGSGSLAKAVADANANPGTDTITFTRGLVVDVSDCPALGTASTKYFMATVTDSVVFDGKGATLQGTQSWINSSGDVNPSGQCPATKPNIILTSTPGFLNLSAGKTATVRDLKLDQLESIARVQTGGTLAMTDVAATKIRPITKCQTPAILAQGADVNLVRNEWTGVTGWAGSATAVPSGGVLVGSDNSSLTIDRSRFSEVGDDGTIVWDGGKVDIVSSQFLDASGMTTLGDAAVNLVNSLWIPESPSSNLQSYDRMANLSTGAAKWNVQASTLLFGNVVCEKSNCPDDPDLGWITTTAGSGTFNGSIGFEQSAVSSFLSKDEAGANPTWLTGGFTADTRTWLQGDLGISTAGLRALTGQPALLTAKPALPAFPDTPSSYQEWATPLLGSGSNPGVLIDAIANADCGQANELISPIDGSCITKDVFGSPRVDNNDKRNIGAVQNSFAPLLTVTDTKKTSITVAWTQPLDPPSGPVTGYTLSYRPVGSSSWMTVNVSGAVTLTKQVGGLTPDTEYEFKVVGVNASGDGPPSNVVSATTLPDPHLSYPDGLGQKGKKISPLVPHVQDVAVPRSFSLIKGSLPPGLKLDSDTGAITGTPTKAGSFGFTVLVTGANNSAASTKVTIKVQAGPLSPALSYPKGKGEQGERLVPLVPHTSGLSGALRYRLVSGSLPSGVRLNASTGRITGKPAEHGSFRAKIKVTGNSGSATSPVTLKIRKSPTPTTQLKVTARRQNKSLPVGSATKVVTRVRSDGRVVVRTACEVNGVRVGKYCRTTVTKKHAVTVTPACNDKVTYTVRITTKSKGQARSAWTRTWNVAKKPFTPCRSGGTG